MGRRKIRLVSRAKGRIHSIHKYNFASFLPLHFGITDLIRTTFTKILFSQKRKRQWDNKESVKKGSVSSYRMILPLGEDSCSKILK